MSNKKMSGKDDRVDSHTKLRIYSFRGQVEVEDFLDYIEKVGLGEIPGPKYRDSAG